MRSATALPSSAVVTAGPGPLMSAVARPGIVASTADSMSSLASTLPKACSHIIATDRMEPTGLAMFFPAIVGAVPLTGS